MALGSALTLGLLLAGAATPTEQAERLAAQAVALAATQPAAGLTQARKALALTADFEPTAFVTAGRKGEVVEDAYQAARAAYRRHRSRLYQAVGECLVRNGASAPAARYLRRAVDLDKSRERVRALAGALVATGRGREALAVLLESVPSEWDPPTLAVAEQAADAAGLPSLQVEIDRARLAALAPELRPELREGPLRLPERARLSTGGPFHLEGEASLLIYLAEPLCRTCSADVEELQRTAGAARVLAAPQVSDEDGTLRRVLSLYRRNWPLLLGTGVVAALPATPPALVVVARGGWSIAVLRSPFAASLGPVLAALVQKDVTESRPRPGWNGRPVDRAPQAPRPGLTPEGLAPGEEQPAPEAFVQAVAAYRAGRFTEALAGFEALEATGDGWLLPPEARLDRALCLAALGRRDEARRLLLRTGDSRFPDAVDRALEQAGRGK